MSRPARARRAARRPADVRPDGAPLGGADVDAQTARYATAYHAPVLAAETVGLLVTDPAGLYVDGTLGGGGHSAALLDALGPDALVVGIDRDAEARATARVRLADAAGRFVALAGTFDEMDALLDAARLGPRHGRPAAGVLLDLGVSSRQIDAAARGFAFSADGPLDMRMNADAGETAAELVARLSADALADLIYAYGEEGRSRRIAAGIKGAARMETTADLAAAVRRAVPTRDEAKALARVFQALRIAVNDELGQLERALPAAQGVLAPGGRLAVIAYHSLEDRRAKHFLRAGRLDGRVETDPFGVPQTPFEAVTRRAVVASEAEVARNPRARSARLRVAALRATP